MEDSTFRRQILVQMLVLYQFLLGQTTAEKERTLALPTTNKPAVFAHVLSPENVRLSAFFPDRVGVLMSGWGDDRRNGLRR